MIGSWRVELTLVVILTTGLAACGTGEETPTPADADTSAATPVQYAAAEFDVAGMTCGGCTLATELAVKKLDGVISADAEYDDDTGAGRCAVRYDPVKVSPAQMARAIEDVGFTPTLLTAE